MTWTRRARGAWNWLDGVEVPLNEQSESYIVGAGPVEAPLFRWTTSEPRIVISPETRSAISAMHPGAPVWVRQSGSFALSPPLLLTTLP